MTTNTATDLPVLPRECFGRIVATAAVAASVPSEIIDDILQRHMANDWGDLDPDDAAMNREAVLLCEGDRVMSVYRDAFAEEDLWVISYVRNDEHMNDPDFCNTCVMFPSDY